MKAVERVVWVAHDGTEFGTEAQCRAYERQNCGARLIGLTAEQIEAARTLADPELADAFTAFYYELRKARQASGQLKRRRRPDGPEAGQGIGVEERHAQSE
jgi:hypothetical protein